LRFYVPLIDIMTWAVGLGCCLMETKLYSHDNSMLRCVCGTHKLYSMVRHGTLDSLMKSFKFVMSDFVKCYICAKSWELGQILHCYYVWKSYCPLHRENNIDIPDLFKTKPQLMIMTYNTPLHIKGITNNIATHYSAVKQAFYIAVVSQQFVTDRCQCAYVWKSHVRRRALSWGGHWSGGAFVRTPKTQTLIDV